MPDLPVLASLAPQRRSARATQLIGAPTRQVLALLALLTATECASHAAEAAIPETDPAAISADQQGDGGVGNLLRHVEQQVSAGQFVTPQDDSAMITWGQVVRVEQSSPNSIPIRQELEQFAAKVRRRAAQEENAGRLSRSIDFVLFADLAGQLLAETSTTAPAGSQTPEISQKPELSQAPQTSQTPPNGAAPHDSASQVNPEPQLSQDPQISQTTAAPGSVAPQAVAPMNTSVSTPGGGAPTIVASVSTPPPPPAVRLTQPGPAHSTEPSAQASAEASFYIARGDDMLAKKDISAARKYYLFAAQAGSARASLSLGQLYDPAFLAHLGVVGLKPDLAQAKSWYRTSSSLGNQDAAARLRAIILEASQ